MRTAIAVAIALLAVTGHVACAPQPGWPHCTDPVTGAAVPEGGNAYLQCVAAGGRTV